MHLAPLVRRLILAALLLSLNLGAHADPLFDKARQALALSKNLVASDITTDMEMFDGDGKSMGTMRLEEIISGWKNGEPERTIIANSNPEHAAVAKTRFKLGIDNHPDEALPSGTEPIRTGTASLGGTPCVIFQLSGSKGKMRFTARAWIEQASGLPVKMVKEYSGIPMASALVHTVTFSRSADGAWLPATSLVDARLHMLFQKVQIVSKYAFRTWTARPPALP